MKPEDVFTNEFALRYDEETESLLIFTVHNGKPDEIPIRLRLETLKDMGRDGASKWVGERILLLIPKMREEVFNLEPFTQSRD